MPPRKRKPTEPAAVERPVEEDTGNLARLRKAAPSPPAEPVRTVRIRDDDEPVRAGGHVLTERGWRPAPTPERK